MFNHDSNQRREKQKFQSLWSFFFFFCFPPIFDRGFSFFFLFVFLQSLIEDFLFFLLKHIHNLVNEASFLGDPPVLSSEGEGRNSYPGSRFMAEKIEVMAQKGLWKAGHDVCQGICLASGSGTKRMPHIISMTCI